MYEKPDFQLQEKDRVFVNVGDFNVWGSIYTYSDPDTEPTLFVHFDDEGDDIMVEELLDTNMFQVHKVSRDKKIIWRSPSFTPAGKSEFDNLVELAEDENEGRGIQMVRNAKAYFDAGDIGSALACLVNDSDKLQAYPEIEEHVQENIVRIQSDWSGSNRWSIAEPLI